MRRRAYERRLRHSVAHRTGCFYVLSDLERSVLVLRGGVGREPRSRGQVARRLGLERQRVHASERSGLRALRREDRETGCSAEAGSAVGAVVSGVAAGGPFDPLAVASSSSGGLFSEPAPGAEGGPGAAERGTGGVAGERDSGGSALDSIKPDIGPIDTTGDSAVPVGLALLVLLVLAGAFALIVAPRLTRPNR